MSDKDLSKKGITRRTLLRMAAVVGAGALVPCTFSGCNDSGDFSAGDNIDLIIRNGRVMDPYTGMDVRSDVYIKDGKIYAVPGMNLYSSDKTAKGSVHSALEIDASGLVVAPGFIDIHAHEGVLDKTMECFVLDGVTTMIGGNCGDSLYPLDDFFSEMETQGILINFASFVGANKLRELAGVPWDQPAEANQIAIMQEIAECEILDGALGVSYGIQYQPAASWDEILSLGLTTAEHGGITAAHSRDGGAGEAALDALDEMIRLARETGIPHQYSHIGSMLAFGDLMDDALERLADAQAEGLHITADIYGYDAAMAGINASQFDLGVFDRFGCEASDLQVVSDIIMDGTLIMASGSRFTSREQYAEIWNAFFENRLEGCPIIIAHIQKWEKIRLAMQSPYVCICSDGAVYSGADEQNEYFGHPRVAGSASVWLGRFVREEGLVDLMTGLFKLSTMPALILGLETKGRITVGADADITVFDPETIIDCADYGDGFMTPPIGIAYVLVNGEITVTGGGLVSGVSAGVPIRRTWKVPGYHLGLCSPGIALASVTRKTLGTAQGSLRSRSGINPRSCAARWARC